MTSTQPTRVSYSAVARALRPAVAAGTLTDDQAYRIADVMDTVSIMAKGLPEPESLDARLHDHAARWTVVAAAYQRLLAAWPVS